MRVQPGSIFGLRRVGTNPSPESATVWIRSLGSKAKHPPLDVEMLKCWNKLPRKSQFGAASMFSKPDTRKHSNFKGLVSSVSLPWDPVSCHSCSYRRRDSPRVGDPKNDRDTRGNLYRLVWWWLPVSSVFSFCGPMFASLNSTCNFLDLDRFCKVSKRSNNHLFFLAGSYSTPWKKVKKSIILLTVGNPCSIF